MALAPKTGMGFVEVVRQCQDVTLTEPPQEKTREDCRGDTAGQEMRL